jgi:hypothetical protein
MGETMHVRKRPHGNANPKLLYQSVVWLYGFFHWRDFERHFVDAAFLTFLTFWREQSVEANT